MQPTVTITPELLDGLNHEFRQLTFRPVHEMNYESGRLVVTEDGGQRQDFHVEPDAQKYLAQMVGCPTDVINKIDDPNLTSLIWNYYIRQRGSDISVLKAVTRNDMITGFTTRSFSPMSPSEVIRACQVAIPDCVLERQPYVTNRKIDFHLTGPDLNENFQSDLGVGLQAQDVHHFSIGVSYDFQGGDSPNMRSYGHRHRCGNIMESPYGVGGKQFRIFTTQPEIMVQKFAEYTRKGVEFVRSVMIPHIRATMESRLEEPQQEIIDLAHRHNMPDRLQELVFESYRAEDLGGTQYHLINALTRAANSDRCPPQWIQRLRQIAGETTVKHDPANPGRRCNSCHQKINLPTNPSNRRS